METPETHYEDITIQSDTDQMVYISAYTYDSQHIRNGACYDEAAIKQQELWLIHDKAERWHSLKWYNYAHTPGV